MSFFRLRATTLQVWQGEQAFLGQRSFLKVQWCLVQSPIPKQDASFSRALVITMFLTAFRVPCFTVCNKIYNLSGHLHQVVSGSLFPEFEETFEFQVPQEEFSSR